MIESFDDILGREEFAELLDASAAGEHQLRRPAGSAGTALAETIRWLDDRKAANHITVKRVGINTLDEWHYDRDGTLSRRDNRFFRVVGIEVTSDAREVSSWGQPILVNPESGIIGLLERREAGNRSFLMQAKAEAGNRGIIQLGPTVQFTPGNYAGNEKIEKPFLFDAFAGNGTFHTLWEGRQAEEGARFYREEHLHRVLLLPAGVELDLPPDYRWLSEEELRFFLHLGEWVNSCARSIIACLL